VTQLDERDLEVLLAKARGDRVASDDAPAAVCADTQQLAGRPVSLAWVRVLLRDERPVE
jgi:hypothetical protein